MYLASALDDERLAQLTRRTLQATTDRGFWRHGAADRAMEPPSTKAKARRAQRHRSRSPRTM